MDPSPSGKKHGRFLRGRVLRGPNGHRNPASERFSAAEQASWVGIVANRSSGSGASQHLVRRLVRELGKLGLDPRSPGLLSNGSALVTEAGCGTGCRCLVAVGGDGTVSALINEQPKVPITVLPAGTENLAAQHFRIAAKPGLAGPDDRRRPGAPDGPGLRGGPAIHADDRLRLRRRCGDPAPPLSDDSISGKVKPTHRAAYVEPILRASLFYRFPSDQRGGSRTRARGRALSGTTVFVFNLPRYALGLPFAPRPARMTDCSTWSSSATRDRSRRFTTCGECFEAPISTIPGVFHRRVRRVTRDLARGDSRPARRRSRGISAPARRATGMARAGIGPPAGGGTRLDHRGHSRRGRCAGARGPPPPPVGSARQKPASCVRIPSFRGLLGMFLLARSDRRCPRAAASQRRKGARRGRFHSQPRRPSGRIKIGKGQALALIAGPCVMEPGDLTDADRTAAGRDLRFAGRVPLVFKASL